MVRHLFVGLLLVPLCCLFLIAQENKSESFDSDPSWEGFNNRIVPASAQLVTQDFGYTRTKFAGTSLGEIGGQIWRTSRPAVYAKQIPRSTLEDPLNASGTFALTKTTSDSGVIFGWFRHPLRSSGRPISSLAWYLDGDNEGARMLTICVTGHNQQHGAWVTQYEQGKKYLPLKADGTRHTWSISYDPDAGDGRGAIQVTLDNAPPVTAVLLEGMKDDLTEFDRFGLMNVTKGGGPFAIYIDDLTINGERMDFATDPKWEAIGNREQFEDRQQPGVHDFGYSETNFAGGEKGEIGGVLWRAEQPHGHYADPIDTLSLEHRMVAEGRIAFLEGAPDSAAFIGFLHSKSREGAPGELKNALGVFLEGPGRVGHYFRPVCATKLGTVADPGEGTILLQDGKPRKWSMEYDPTGNDGKGVIHVTIDGATTKLLLPDNHKTEGAEFDRFGLATLRPGGSHVKIYLDDLQYTAKAAGR